MAIKDHYISTKILCIKLMLKNSSPLWSDQDSREREGLWRGFLCLFCSDPAPIAPRMR